MSSLTLLLADAALGTLPLMGGAFALLIVGFGIGFAFAHLSRGDAAEEVRTSGDLATRAARKLAAARRDCLLLAPHGGRLDSATLSRMTRLTSQIADLVTGLSSGKQPPRRSRSLVRKPIVAETALPSGEVLATNLKAFSASLTSRECVGVLVWRREKPGDLERRFGPGAADDSNAELLGVIGARLSSDEFLQHESSDRFVVLLKGDSEAALHQRADELRQAVRNGAFELNGTATMLTAAFGLAVASSEESVRELPARSVLACEEASRRGRNQLLCHEAGRLAAVESAEKSPTPMVPVTV